MARREGELHAAVQRALNAVPRWSAGGYVRGYRAGVLIAEGLAGTVGIGDVCAIRAEEEAPRADGKPDELLAEAVGFEGQRVYLVPFREPRGLGTADRIAPAPDLNLLHPDRQWLGRVLDARGRPVDQAGPLPRGPRAYPIKAPAMPAAQRNGLGPRMTLGVRALDVFTPCCEGQRLGIFAGSGVGKSTLLSMIARGTQADVLVVGLVGERGRELHDFLHHTLGPRGRARSVVVVATSDEPAMQRRQAALVAMTVAEAFRDQGLRVLCLIDSVTRYAMALREIYLAAGEAPASRGYPPSVFAELPKLLERAGPGAGQGTITGLFSVLVDGDDTNEPISDTVRGILDGHVILDRGIAEGGRFPAVDVLKSVSRTAPGCYAPSERELVRDARAAMRAHAEVAELIQLGAYRGGNAAVDRAVALRPALEDLLRQELDEPADEDGGFARLARVMAS